MTYILENNYILESQYNTLTALRLDYPSGTKLFLLNPFLGDTVTIKTARTTEGQNEEDEYITIYWSPSNGNLSEEWLDKSESEWRELFSEIDLSSFEDQLPNFPLVRFIL